LGIGDLLTGVPALRGLRRRFPNSRIVLAVPEELSPLAFLTGAVDDIAPTPRLGAVCYPGRPISLAVNLHGQGPQSIEHLKALNASRILSYRHPHHPEIVGPCWRSDIHEVDRWCALMGWADIDCVPEDLLIERPVDYPGNAGVVVMHPGAAAPARRWPAGRFASVARALTGDGHRVVITGSTAERSLAESVAEAAELPNSAVLAGQLSITGLVALIADCALLVSGDTGIAHIATATGTPSVLVFGPTAPNRWGPRISGPHRVLWAGRSGDPHGEQPDPGLLLVQADEVLSNCRAMVREPV
jgi:ADP-heptose:LPS heptosyltransferase